ncbi:DUF6745 domain-containing protein [Nocardia sp. NPDC006630]|uniref:DUF6745 domain-containing protein n=1 Tax=Nocardia sp. NPDC006630 TaxID=3157181 RepID=UPI0033AE9CAE
MQTIDEWRAVATATAPADRRAAEAAVRRAYTDAGLTAPSRYLWVDSPLAAVAAVRALENPGRAVLGEIRTRPWAAERRSVHAELGPEGWAERWNATGAQLWDNTRMLTDRIRAGVVAALLGPESENEDRKVRAAAASDIRGLLLDAVLGQHDAPWLAAFEGSDRLAGLAAVARNAGWWWPFEQVVVLSERPVRLLRDEAGRLHAADGPALVYPDGFALHAWRGMPVPADFLANLNALTPGRIRTEENAELRRVMLEIFGYDRYLAESNAEPVHRDETGILWRIPLPDDEDVAMVEVVNSTAEPDGTFNTYWLRVPPGTRTAKEGVAWTFGLTAADYEPLRQT